MICRRATYFTDSEMIEYYQNMCNWNSKSRKTRNCDKLHQIHYARKQFLIIYVGMYNCYENVKINLWSKFSILKPWHCRNFQLQKKWLLSLTTFCKLLQPFYCFIYWGIPNIVLLLLAEQINVMLFYYVQDV